jgi:hypothetical protein
MSKMSSQFGIIVEYLWLVIAIVSFATSIHSAYKFGITGKDTITFFVMSIIAVMMFLFRRSQRKRVK